MMKFLKCIVLAFVLVSCNSNEKKDKTNNDRAKDIAKANDPDLKKSIANGKVVYDNFCINCHMADGKGVPKAFPPLADSDYLRENQLKSIAAVKNGMSGKIVVNGVTYNGAMAPLGLSDEEVADVMNYINNSWGNRIDNFITPEKVSKL